MIIHKEPTTLAGKTVKIKADAFDIEGEIIIEDWWDRVYGSSWMNAKGNRAAIRYAIRSAMAHLPTDDEVLYGKIDGLGYIVHVSELDLSDEGNKPKDKPSRRMPYVPSFDKFLQLAHNMVQATKATDERWKKIGKELPSFSPDSVRIMDMVFALTVYSTLGASDAHNCVANTEMLAMYACHKLDQNSEEYDPNYLVKTSAIPNHQPTEDTRTNKSIKDLSPLVGQVLTNVDMTDDEIMLTTKSGMVIRIYHRQDCCETVRIEDTKGNWHDLIGKVIIEAYEDVQSEDDPQYGESCTRTDLTFRVDDATVLSRWIGTSNGYYSESVDFEMVKFPTDGTTPNNYDHYGNDE